MCLYTEYDAVPTVAEQDIEVYKVVIRDDDGTLLSPFQNFEYKVGERYDGMLILNQIDNVENSVTIRSIIRLVESKVKDKKLGSCHVGFHSFVSLEQLNEVYTTLDGILANRHVVLRCVIPKGETYYKGIWPTMVPTVLFGKSTIKNIVVENYASSSIKVIEVIE